MFFTVQAVLPTRLKVLAETRYSQEHFLRALFDLALEEQWTDLSHMIQHDMAKAILLDYSLEEGLGYLNQKVYTDFWEDVIEIGWTRFCEHTGLSRDKVNRCLKEYREAI